MVAALRETSVIFGMLLAVLFLGERFTLTKLAAVVMVAASTMLMKMQ
jgi:drug/metabolite transporter (DMT)-like permease